MGEVIPVTLRASSGSSSIPTYGTVSAGLDEGSQSVGQDLHEERQRCGKTLLDVASALKIAPDYLSAIETGRFEELPARVYAVGYVRSYAAYLGLDATSFATRFKGELNEANIADPAVDFLPLLPPVDDSAAPTESKPSAIRLPSLPENALSQIAGVLLLVGAISYAAYHVISSAPQIASPFASLPAQLAPDAGLTGEPIDAPTTEIPHNLHPPKPPSLHEVPLPLPTIDLQLAAAEELKPVPVQPLSSEPIELASSPPEHPPLPVRKEPRAIASVERPVIQSREIGAIQRVSASNRVGLKLRPSLRLGQHYGMDNKDSRITLRLHGATEIMVGDSRNKVFIDRTLDAGDTYRVPNVSGLKLSAPDAGAIEIILDDTTVGFAGKDGSPAREMSLDPKALVRPPQGG